MNRFKRAVTLAGILLFLSCMAWGQAVFAPVIGAKWTYTYRSFSYNVFTGHEYRDNSIIRAEYEKDTIIGNRNYKLILLHYESLYKSRWPILVNYFPVGYDSAIGIGKRIHKFMTRYSQDTIWGFVDQINSEKPYFIFSQAPYSFSFNQSDIGSPKVFIDSVSTSLFGNMNLKTWNGYSFRRLFVDGPSIYDTFSLSFTERIGPINDIMLYFAFNGHPGNIDKRYPYGLVCYEDSEVGEIKFMDLDCDLKLVSTLETFKDETIQSQYNPYTRSIEIHMKAEQVNQWQFSLVHVSGQVVLTTFLKDFNNYISVPQNLPSGIYFSRMVHRVTGQNVAHKYFISN